MFSFVSVATIIEINLLVLDVCVFEWCSSLKLFIHNLLVKSFSIFDCHDTAEPHALVSQD